MELVQQLKEDGKAKGLCRMWQMKLKTGLDYEQLIQLYIRGIDFCISENYPTLDFIREHFKGKCEVYGVFVDDEVTSMSEETGGVIAGRLNAFVINQSDQTSIMRQALVYQAEIAANTKLSASELTEIKSTLKRIENKDSSLLSQGIA